MPCNQAARLRRLQRQLRHPGRDVLHQPVLQSRVERDALERPAAIVHILAADGAGQRGSHPFAEHVHVFGAPGVVGQRFQNGHQVADGDALAQQMLQDLLHLADGHQSRDQFFNDGGVVLC